MPKQAACETNGAIATPQDSARLPPLTESSAESRRENLREQLMLLLLRMLCSLPFVPLAASILTSSLGLPSPRGPGL